MSWAAANAPKFRREKPTQEGIDPPDLVSPARDKRRSTETVEAALSRLSKAYSTSMECIGALSKTNRMVQKDPSKLTDDTVPVMDRVAMAARSTLEHGILMDPLILPHVDTVNGTMLDLSARDSGGSGCSDRWDAVTERRPVPPILSSAAHKSTVRELAYLALVNYSDLLQSCSVCASSADTDEQKRTLLDRGVVKKVQTLQDKQHSSWKDESDEDTQRLTVTALCDASKLDGSDPTLWLKLACASRRLEHVIMKATPSTIGRSKHRRLQRYALERGTQALPPNMPPNRAVKRALEELLSEPEPEEYESILMPEVKPVELVLELPRYSWSMLGRMLLRACREGTDFHMGHKHHSSSTNRGRAKEVIHFGSPSIVMSLSSMLCLPTRVLGRICLFLENSSIWRFEATCRALSVAIISARALMEQEETSKEITRKNEKVSSEEQKEHRDRSVSEVSAEKKKEESDERGSKSKTDMEDKKHSRERQTGRSSQRLRSQQITSGKKAERSAKRQSFEYCFLAASGSTTIDEHNYELMKAKSDESVRRLLSKPGFSRSPLKTKALARSESSEALDSKRREAQERIADSSLSSFVERWSGHNSGPMDLVTSYMSHIAMHATDVFASDPGGAVVLTSCILSCFEMSMKRSGFPQQLVPRFYKIPSVSGISKSLVGFAIDLLHAELVLKQCDRYNPTHVVFDDDSNRISLMVPELYETCEELNDYIQEDENGIDQNVKKQYLMLRIRCSWLLAGFYLWRSRIAQNIWEAREAEEEGTAFIVEASQVFNSPELRDVGFVKTPHLLSPGRTEAHWKEISQHSLTKYRDEIQASSVVSLVRQKFQDLVVEIGRKPPEAESELPTIVSDENAKVLSEIGGTLFARYKSEYGDNEAKHSELIEDFLNDHGGELILPGDSTPSDKGRLSRLVPLGRVDIAHLLNMSSPSILSMLITCLNIEAMNQYQVALLLARLVLSCTDFQNSLLNRISSASTTRRDDDDFSDSDDDSLMSGDASKDRNQSNKNTDERIALQCGYLVNFLIERLCESFSTCLTRDEKQRFIACKECDQLIKRVLDFSSYWFDTTAKHFAPEDSADQLIFRSIQEFVGIVWESTSSAERLAIHRRYFNSLSKILIFQRHTIEGMVRNHGDRSTRASKQKSCTKRAEYLRLVASEAGLLLSQYPGIVQDLILLPSDLLIELSSADTDPSDESFSTFSRRERRLLLDAALWLWKYSSQSLTEVAIPGQISALCSSFDRPIVKVLRNPVAVLVTGLCGSVFSSKASNAESSDQADEDEDLLCLTEFFDSDASANEWLSDNDDKADSDWRKRKQLLRVICHAVQCISLVLDTIHDKGALSISSDRRNCKNLGPLLPLVTTRVLNFFSTSLLRNFIDDNQEDPNIWSEGYPFSTRTVGELLDSNLHKSYRWLYGFVLIGEKAHLQSAGKDSATTAPPICDLGMKGCHLENTSAAAQLYRCVVRAYAGGRRSPPKAALELVSSALPPLKESEHSKAVRDFLFDPEEPSFLLEQLTKLVNKADGWDKPFKEIHQYLSHDRDGEVPSSRLSVTDEEVLRVRRGILSELAGGPLPLSTHESGKSKSDNTPDDDRLASFKNEEEITKKFEAILDDLCLGEIENSEGWYRAAQCVNLKADLIADRLGLSKGFGRNPHFKIPSPRPYTGQSLPLDELGRAQEDEDAAMNANWIYYLGNDLSVYARYSWSSYSSLRECSDEIGRSYVGTPTGTRRDGDKPSSAMVWKRLNGLARKGNHLAWQEAWGGMFVYALRKLSVRFMSVALYMLQSKSKQISEGKVLISELCESLGIILYSDLMGSQNYGYPMRAMGGKRKRDLANAAKVCFGVAAKVVEEPSDEDDGSNEDRATWDLVFMTGKCDEKIASTYKLEAHKESTDESRLYEKHMASAMQQYSSAYAQAKTIEEDGGFIVEQSGGSAHGCTEVLYRMLATRLKIIIAAVSRSENELDMAEAEALRLTEKHWFKQPEDEKVLKDQHTRDRVWNVLVDVVAGLAQCRVDHPFFHRSVYRHAQALMWSPLLYDPTCTEGSLATVPATRSFQIRGLNNSTNVAQSAEVAMSSLFDKKRSQLCAVWVTTTPSSSPFQLLNNSTRKYDSLRGKYISAYVETLRLCHRRSKLETFLKWTSTSRRDLPNYFQVSALGGGGIPDKSHANDSILMIRNNLTENGFLVTVKRQTNNAFAEALSFELTEKSARNSPIGDTQKKVTEQVLKYAYASYLRLHCSKEDLDQLRAWKYGGTSIAEVEAVCQAYLALEEESSCEETMRTSDLGDWSGKARKSAIFDAALVKCKVLFPSLSGTFFSKKAAGKSKKTSTTDDADAPPDGNGKRKDPEPETTAMSYEVAVPPEVKAGESFFTTVKVGGTTKKLKLTVPDTNPSTLRFTLHVPKEVATETQKAAKKGHVDDEEESKEPSGTKNMV